MPMMQWASAYAEHAPAHCGGAKGHSSSHVTAWSATGHPLGALSLGPLLFALKLQAVLERVDAACEEAPLVSHLYYLVGKLTQAAGAFRRLCVDDTGVLIGLEPRLPECGIYVGDKELVAAEAAMLWIAHQLDGFNSVGTALGSAKYICNALGRRAATVETLVDTLAHIPLYVQPQVLLLRVSLQARMAHLTRTVPREALARATRRVRAARTLECGDWQRLCSTCLNRWLSTVSIWRRQTMRAARWVCR